MRKRETGTSENAILVDTIEAARRLGVGKSTAAKIGQEAGAVVKFGKRTMYSVRKLEEFCNGLAK